MASGLSINTGRQNRVGGPAARSASKFLGADNEPDNPCFEIPDVPKGETG